MSSEQQFSAGQEADANADPDDTVKLEMRTNRRTRKRFKQLCADIDPDASYEEVIEHIINRHEANPEFLSKNYR